MINAIAAERYDAALTEAKEVDDLIAKGLSEEDAKKKPFLGITHYNLIYVCVSCK